MDMKTVNLRCDCGCSAVTFVKYTYTDDSNHTYLAPDYEINVEDSYIGAQYQGFFGRFRRAWRAFFAKPVIYAGTFSDNREKMRTFFLDSLALLEEDTNEN